MTMEDVKRRLEHIRAVAQELDDAEQASSLERALLIDAIEASIAGKVDNKTLKEVMKVQVIQFRRWI